MDNEKLVVGIADMKLAKGTGMLVTYALGSCIGICLYDAQMKIGALVHIMLPFAGDAASQAPLKYADTGIKETVQKMVSMGANRIRITAKIAGGAKMFETGPNSTLGNIGARNTMAVSMTLRKEGIRIIAEDTGGAIARTMLFDIASGQACVRCYGRPELII